MKWPALQILDDSTGLWLPGEFDERTNGMLGDLYSRKREKCVAWMLHFLDGHEVACISPDMGPVRVRKER